MESRLLKIIDNNKKHIKGSKVADYIPALKEANINDVGICLVNKDSTYKVGEYNKEFTIQSISKVFTLALAIIDNGVNYVFDKVGFMATDEPFNTIYKLGLSEDIKPANSMINSGAILTTSLIKKTNKEPIDRIIELIQLITGNKDIEINKEVYLSEKETGFRNIAMANLMKSNNLIKNNCDIDKLLETYFMQCSININVVDLAKLAYFITSGCKGLDDYGKTNPKELQKVLLTQMITCGMYNYSTEYLYRVGIPSKSGVSGGILASSLEGYGIGIYSPGLDENGNSKVGIKILEEISKDLNLSMI